MMKSNLLEILAVLSLVSAFAMSARGQTLGIRVDESVHIDIETLPTEQFWLTESENLADWTKRTFVDHSMTLDLGPPNPGSRFFRLDPLYGKITWAPMSNMPVARDQFTGGVIDGKLYLFGGNGPPNPPYSDNLSRMDIYDLETKQWSRGADYTQGLEELSSAVLDGKLYIFGADSASINICYDPAAGASGAWSQLAPKTTPIQAATVLAWGAEILVLGGYLPGGGFATAIEAYRPSLENSGTWRTVTNLPEPFWAFAAGIDRGILYLVGGLTELQGTFQVLNKVRRYDLNNGIWLPDIEGILPHPVFADYSSACPVVNGKLVIAAGAATLDGSFTVSDPDADLVHSHTVLIYDTETNTFSENTVLPEPFGSHLVLLADDQLLIMGGEFGPRWSDSGPSSRMWVGSFGDEREEVEIDLLSYFNPTGTWLYDDYKAGSGTPSDWTVRSLGTATVNGSEVIVMQEYGPTGVADDRDYISTDFTETVSEIGHYNHGEGDKFWSRPVPMLRRTFVPGQAYWSEGLQMLEIPGSLLDQSLRIDFETVTVPAGTFDCVKVTETLVIYYPDLPENDPGTLFFTLWYAPQVGLVKKIAEDGELWELKQYDRFTP